MVEELCCKPKGRGFDSRWGHLFSSVRLTFPSRTMDPGYTQPAKEMSTGRYLGVKRGQRVRLTT
jgi:hypothetical protein